MLKHLGAASLVDETVVQVDRQGKRDEGVPEFMVEGFA